MKKCYISLLVMILFVLIPMVSFADTSEDKFNELTVEVNIDKNGTAKITEKWDIEIYSGTELYKSYYNMEDSVVQNLTVKDKNGKTYETQSSWNVNGTFESKKNKCGINIVEDGYEICWGISEYGKNVYMVSYEITNFVQDYSSYQMTYFTIVPTGLDPSPAKVTVRVSSFYQFADSNITYTGEGYTGNSILDDGILLLTASNGLTPTQKMTVQIKYLDNPFSIGTSLSSVNSAQTSTTEVVPTEENSEEEAAQKSSNKWETVIVVALGFLAAAAVIIRVRKNKESTDENNLSGD